MSESIISQVSKFMNNLEEEDLRNILESEEQDEVEAVVEEASEEDSETEYEWEA